MLVVLKKYKFCSNSIKMKRKVKNVIMMLDQVCFLIGWAIGCGKEVLFAIVIKYDKKIDFQNTKFSPEAILEAYKIFKNQFTTLDQEKEQFSILDVEFENTSWTYNNDEEFFSDYRRKDIKRAVYNKTFAGGKFSLFFGRYGTIVEVELLDRKKIESTCEIFEKYANNSKLPIPEKIKVKPTLFIGHGRSNQWRDLKDHLQDKHQYVLEAYEVGARAGHAIRDILENMMKKSNFAILVMTA
jgi:hypothetical protein